MKLASPWRDTLNFDHPFIAYRNFGRFLAQELDQPSNIIIIYKIMCSSTSRIVSIYVSFAEKCKNNSNHNDYSISKASVAEIMRDSFSRFLKDLRFHPRDLCVEKVYVFNELVI